ncbi:UNVERIFIED_CONTAM: hypothetical protein Slati_1327900 [Sesamum latifolium]|uniref:Reverse transcriptase zinc-binding domain-containing protein n=1 Tax=Sesamum latifolium TaxID=2727402 RepID=A0AAW2XI66_9LAMI
MKDIIIWHFTKSGTFSVRSAYHWICNSVRKYIPSSSAANSSSHRIGWLGIWNAKIPNKIKVFIWRLCSDFLPTGSNINRRFPFSAICCPFCQEANESNHHAFLLCHFSRIVWGLSNLRWAVIFDWSSSACDWIFNAHRALDPKDFELMLVICWSIWWCRNKLWSHGDLHPPDQVVSFARGYLESFEGTFETNPDLEPILVPSSWRPPKLGIIKINFDAVVFKDTDDTTLG